MRCPSHKVLAFLFILLGYPFVSFSQLSLPYIFGNQMVLQRDINVPVWGKAKSDSKITITFAGKKYSARADKEGHWKTKLAPTPAGGPYELVISSGKETIRYTDVLLGDVYVCGGQSNMEWTIEKSNKGKEEADSAHFGQIRIITIPKNRSYRPLDNTLPTQWKKAEGDSILNFSAVAYYFGKYIHKDLGIPIGLVSDNWGGTNSETWTSLDGIRQIPYLKEFADSIATVRLTEEEIKVSNRLKQQKWFAQYLSDDKGASEGWEKPGLDDSQWKEINVPGSYEDSLMPGFDGSVWFRKHFTIPESMRGQALYIRLGFINEKDVAYVNGKEIGRTYNADEWRVYKVSADVLNSSGDNVLTVRILDFNKKGGFVETFTPNMVISLERYTKIPEQIKIHGKWKFKVGVDLTGKPMPDKLVFYQYDQNKVPSMLYNAMLAPIIPFGIRGAIWYQGEANADRAYEYRTNFPLMIKDWRKNWGQGDFPFFFVQLANYRNQPKEPDGSDWAELREAQFMTLSLPNTGMACTIDIGEANDIHPKNKKDVGYRLSRAALKVAYGKHIEHSGPVFSKLEIVGNKAIVSFEHADGGLQIRTRYGYVTGFAVAGEDRKFYWAKGTVEGNKVILESDKVSKPAAVRYGWSINPEDLGLYNKEGLPAVPFRTDAWPGVTEGKKYR